MRKRNFSDVFSEIYLMIKDNGKFIEKISKEKDIYNSLIVFLVSSLVASLAAIVIYSEFNEIGGWTFVSVILTSLILLTMYSWAVNLMTNMYGGQANFVQIFNVMAYTSVPYLFGTIFRGRILGFVAFALMIYTVFLGVNGISFVDKISKGKALVSYITPFAILLLISIILISLGFGI